MLTKADIKLLVENFPTRSEFEFELAKIREEMATKNDVRDLKGLVESVFTEVKNMREEQSAHFNEHRRINDDLQSLDKSVKKLESPASVSHRIKK